RSPKGRDLLRHRRHDSPNSTEDGGRTGRSPSCGAAGPRARPGAGGRLPSASRPRLRDQRERLLLRQLLAVGVPRLLAPDAALRPSPSRDHQAAAARARLRVGFLVDRELTLGVAAARVEGAEPAPPFDQLALAALRTG